jgi:AcrR family transcriptional regulator
MPQSPPPPPPKRRGRPPSGGREAILTATLELLAERGIARLTTRAIAERAGVSEASVFYHYTDRAGLLQAGFARGLEPLNAFNERGIDGADTLDVLLRVGAKLEEFLDLTLPVLVAAQSDPELRDALAQYMADNDLGAHRGVLNLGTYLAAERDAGRIRADADVEAVALLAIASSFLRVFQRGFAGHADELPGRERTAAALALLVAPPGAPDHTH